ncbi:uncharacterized protein LOC119403352 [Rhipicephalus sanguineus]|uniref:uncharacterized protein LOC119403352 n=1 Tax=Rhipicephalus sanguineus TaxID=34632 RepID=UPI001894E5DA|nr:uncharacterized protein LOC119403352 [Rhipicephalus sanguineus]
MGDEGFLVGEEFLEHHKLQRYRMMTPIIRLNILFFLGLFCLMHILRQAPPGAQAVYYALTGLRRSPVVVRSAVQAAAKSAPSVVPRKPTHHLHKSASKVSQNVHRRPAVPPPTFVSQKIRRH